MSIRTRSGTKDATAQISPMTLNRVLAYNHAVFIVVGALRIVL